MIYFDHNATTPPDERVVEAMLPYLKTFYGNPSSIYRFGRLARSAIDTAREQVAALVDVQPAQVIFTSGGTEANSLALHNIPEHAAVAISTIEHPSITEPVSFRRSSFRQLQMIEVDSNGLIEAEAMDRLKLEKNDFVSVMLANNETGTIQNIRAIAEKLAGQGVIFHTDAVQALGKIPLSFPELGADLMSLSSHKVYGPKGCGALVASKGFDLYPLLIGGGQENGLRAGTENVAAIVGFGKAAELAKSEITERSRKLLMLRNKLEQALLEIDEITIFAREAERLPNTTQISVQGVDGEMLLMQFDRHNVAVSSGSACAAGDREASPVLTAMGVDPVIAKSAIRISLGKNNSEEEVKEFISILKRLLGY